MQHPQDKHLVVPNPVVDAFCRRLIGVSLAEQLTPSVIMKFRLTAQRGDSALFTKLFEIYTLRDMRIVCI